MNDHERMASSLESTGDYRVLRRISPRDQIFPDDGSQKKIGVILDVETTGLDSAHNEVLELGMLKFQFAADGRVFSILDQFQAFQQPTSPIPPEITKLTGITDAMVEGSAIDPVAVAGFVDDAVVVIAHNARFDRRFAERKWPVFTLKAWACSLNEVDWTGEGTDGRRLSYLLNGYGLFHDGHRAVEDCRALLELLARPLPMSGELGLKRLLDTARRSTVRIWAENSPFESKDQLKARGYRWSDGTDGRPKSWWVEVDEQAAPEELHFLQTDIYQREIDLPTKRLTAFDRYSDRS